LSYFAFDVFGMLMIRCVAAMFLIVGLVCFASSQFHSFWGLGRISQPCLKVLTVNTFAPGLNQVVRAKTAGSHVALHECNCSAESGRELFKGSKDLPSLLVCTRKKFLNWGCGFFVSVVISGGLLEHLGPLHLDLGPNC